MFDVKYLYKFSLVNCSNEARRRTLLGPDEAEQRHFVSRTALYQEIS